MMILTTLLTLLFSGSTYYVSSTSGNDANSGTGPDQAWQTLAKVNTHALMPGDSVLFKSGDEFIGQLLVTRSGADGAPIVFSRYGTGSKPILNSASSPGGAFESSVLFRNNSYIVLQDLEITNDRKVSRSGVSDQVGYGIFVHNNGDEVMRSFILRNLTVRGVYAINTTGVDFDALQVSGIFFRSERNTETGKAKHIRDILIEDNFITLTGKFGIWTQHAGGDAGVGNDSINRNMDIVIRNNHTFQTGGSGAQPGRSYNLLMEGNTFEYPGSNVDPRMAKRGSGAWFWSTRNVVAQYNRTLHARGPADTYSIHIDHSNKDVFVQYNYSEDNEGGFAEILGENINSVYRFNVSVNDGIRNNNRSIWVSQYAGVNRSVTSDSNFVYNNTIYVGNNRTTGIHLDGDNTYIFNNILYSAPGSSIGNRELVINITDGSELKVTHNLYQGTVNSGFTSLDVNAVFGDPLFEQPGGLDNDSYRLAAGSPALGAGIAFRQPRIRNAGHGIFKDVPPFPTHDLYGNELIWQDGYVPIGAYGGEPELNAPPVGTEINKTGYLLNSDGEPVIGMEVALYEGNTMISSSVTDNSGAFTLTFLSRDATLRFESGSTDLLRKTVLDEVLGRIPEHLGDIRMSWVGGQVEDIDGHTYRTMILGDQVWMAENLKTSRFSNGDILLHAIENTDWGATNATGTAAWSVHNNEAADSPKALNRGKLYNWYAASDPRGVCPTGWSVPSDSDFAELESFLGMPEADLALTNFTRGQAQEIGNRMKSTGSRYWQAPNTAATNEFGLSVRSGSMRFAGGAFGADGAFEALGSYAAFWTSTETNATNAFRRILHVNEAGINRNTPDKRFGLSIRCVRPFDPAIDTSTEEKTSHTPSDIRLYQNYPNPFNPTTVIGYEVPVSGRARLAVYDVLGREVVLLADGVVSAGFHTVYFDGSTLSSGVYLYRLSVNGQDFTKRLTLLK